MAGCGVHLQNQLLEKADEEGMDALSDQERRVVEADEDELDDVVPDNYGPASDEWDGDYCKFCYGVGRVGALVFGLLPVLLVFGLFQLDAIDVGSRDIGLLIGAIAGVVVWKTLDKKVKVRGYFPVLGPKLGPIVEGVAAKFGVYLTATARRQAREAEPEPGTGTVDHGELPGDAVVDEREDGSVEVNLPGNPSERERKLKKRLKQQKQITKKERAKKTEHKAEKQEKEKELNEVQSTLQKKDQELEKKEKQVKEKEDILDTLFGIYGRNQLAQGAIPLLGWDEEDNPVFKGFVVNTVWHDLGNVDEVEHYHEEYPNALIVDTLDDAKDLMNVEGGVDDRISGMDEFRKLAQYGRWLINPTEVKNFPKYENPERPGYPNTNPQTPIQAREHYPEVLFWNSAAGLREARKEPDTHSDRPKLPFYISAFNDAGGYKPPGFDPRGSEDRTELRDDLRYHERMLGNAHHTLQQLQKEYKKLNHEKTRLENQLEHQEALTLDARDNEKGALTQAQKLTRELETSNTSIAMMDNEVEETRDLQERTDERRRQNRREKIEESDSFHEEVETAKSERNRVKKVTDAFETIRAVGYRGNGHEVDLDAVADGESEHSKEDVVRMFLEDDDLDQQLSRVQNSITGILTDDAAAGGTN